MKIERFKYVNLNSDQINNEIFHSGEYLIVSSSDEDNRLPDFGEEIDLKNDFNDELANVLNLIKETNILKT